MEQSWTYLCGPPYQGVETRASSSIKAWATTGAQLSNQLSNGDGGAAFARQVASIHTGALAPMFWNEERLATPRSIPPPTMPSQGVTMHLQPH